MKCINNIGEISFLKSSYKRFVLVSKRRHIEDYGHEDDETLFVSSDWLLWQKCVAERIHCVYHETGFAAWNRNDPLESELFIQTNQWVYLDGQDATRFHDVSIGKQFNRQLQIVLWNAVKLEFCLDNLTKRFKPQEYILYDYYMPAGLIDSFEKKIIVKAVAQRYTVRFVDNFNSTEASKLDAVGASHAQKLSPPILRDRVKALYLWLFDWFSRCWCALQRRKKIVLFFTSGPLHYGLMKSFRSRNILPLFVGANMPKTLKATWYYLKCGFRLADLPRASLSRTDEYRVKEIIQTFERSWAADSNPSTPDAVVRHYIKTYIFDSKWIYKMAIEVKRNQILFARYDIAHLVVVGIGNPLERIKIELANLKGIEVDYILHGVRFHKMKYDMLCGDRFTKSMISRCLTWGKMNEIWLREVGAETKIIRTGNPGYDIFRNLRHKSNEKAENAMVLQYDLSGDDLTSPYANNLVHFVESVALLQDMGYSTIRFRPHIGHGFDRKLYNDIIEFFDLKCTIADNFTFPELIEWADITIGPVETGAFLETIASGKNYFAMCLPPNSVIKDYLKIIKIISDFTSLRHAIESHDVQDNRAVLNAFCSFDEIPYAGEKFWEVLEDAVA